MATLRGGRGQGYGGCRRCFSSCLFRITQHQRRYVQALAERFLHRPSTGGGTAEAVADTEVVDMKRWKKLNSTTLGIGRGVIPHGPWTVMKILRSEGYDAYLVGGCVRDLLLKKTPKDFDIITTANLDQIKKKFHRAVVVGNRFPICMVHIQDSATEVSSFETVAKDAEGKEKADLSQAPDGCTTEDFIRWKNSLKRDFTINSLFFDPFSNKIYDYSRGISDLKSLKLRTIIPAEVSFGEDCARILRGLRIAARLGLSFSKDTEAALHKLSQSITSLPKGRIFMELNYMLSYGAAEPSLSLLQRFSLLEILLPFHAAYLKQQNNRKPENDSMLMKLFSNMDKVVRCDHPSDCRLWVGLLAFHLALVNKPQDAFVATTLASILYHGEWKEGVRYARENAEVQVHFKPELPMSFISKSDGELAEEVSQLAALVQDSVDILTESECLQGSMSRYPTSLCYGNSVFVPKRVGRDVAEVFQMFNSTHEQTRESFDIDYHSLGKGYMWETRFVLGKIILETMGFATLPRAGETVDDKKSNIDTEVIGPNSKSELSSLLRKELSVNKLRQHQVNQKSDKKSRLETTVEDGGVVEIKMHQDIAKKSQKVDETDESAKGLFSVITHMLDRKKLLEIMKVKGEEKPSVKTRSELSDDDIMEEENGDIKKHQSKVPSVDESRELLKEEVVEDKKEKAKKKKSKIKDERDKGLEAPDEEVITVRKKKDTKKKRKGKNERRSVDEEFECLGEVVIMEEKKQDSKKRKSKNEKASMDEEFEFLGEVVMEENKEDIKKVKKKKKTTTKSKSKDERLESLESQSTEEKKGEAEKNLVQSEKICDLRDKVVNEEKPASGKNDELKKPVTLEKKDGVEEQDKAAGRILLSSLFGWK